jgi:hypothetical protein
MIKRECDSCGRAAECSVYGTRRDGTRYERTDGTIAGPHDPYLCDDCGADYIEGETP